MRQPARRESLPLRPVKPSLGSLEERFADEARFIRTWLDAPGRTGAVSPSGRFLARAMARQVDPDDDRLVVELGPGTGPVTEALIARGVAPERLVLVEFDRNFCRLLQDRFPRARIVQGDAYRLRESLAGVCDRPIGAVVSSLPLLNRPDEARRALLDQAFDLMGPRGLFVQFTYGLASPIPLGGRGEPRRFHAETDKPIWLNLPPARVWSYRAVGEPRPASAPPASEIVSMIEALAAKKQMKPALALLRKLAESGRAGEPPNRAARR